MPRFSNFCICIIFLFTFTLLWNLLKQTPDPNKNEWPKHWKIILKHSKMLQLILLDGSALKCFYYYNGREGKDRNAACNSLYSNLDARFGTKFNDFDQFWSLLYTNIIKPSDNQVILHAYTKPDTIVLKYNYLTNIEKFIFFTISSNKTDKQHYHLLQGNSIVPTIAIPKISIKSARVNGYKIIVPENVKTYLPFFEAKKFVSCNEEALNGTMEISTDFNTTIPHGAVKKLFELVEIFIDNGQIPFLAFGSLLGWYRECGIIPHTTDFDLHVYASEYDPMIEKVFNSYPEFPLHHRIGKREYSLEYSFFLRHGIKGYSATAVDIFYLYPHNETHEWSPFITSFSSFLRGKSIFPKVQGLCTADLYGYLFFVPCNFIEILKANYGRNRMNSIPNATYFEDGNSNVNDGQWNANQNRSNDEIVHYSRADK